MENGIRNATVLGEGNIKVIGRLVGIELDVFKQGILANGTINIWLRLFLEIDGFGVASSLKVKNAIVVPSMLIVSNQSPVRIGAESGLARS